MHFFNSLNIKLRLSLLFVIFFGLSLILLNISIYKTISSNNQKEFDLQLYNYTVDIAEALDIDNYGELEFNDSIVGLKEKIFPFSLGKTFISILDINGKTISHSFNENIQSALPISASQIKTILHSGVNYQNLELGNINNYRVINFLLPILKKETPLFLQIIVPTDSVKSTNEVLKNTLITFSSFIVILSALIGYVFVSISLRPIRAITDKAKIIEVNNLSEKVPIPQSKDEIFELATTINSLLCKINTAFIAQERFVQHASHQLKTPLAIIKTEIAQLNSPKQFESINEEINSLIKLTNNLLFLAKLDAHSENKSNEEIDLLEIITDQISRLQKIATPKKISFHLNATQHFLSITQSPLYSDSGMLEILFFNLIENAIKYALEKEQIIIEVDLVESKRQVNIINSVDPTIFTNISLETLFERFARGPQMKKYEGHGLGLAICKSISERLNIELKSIIIKDKIIFSLIFPTNNN